MTREKAATAKKSAVNNMRGATASKPIKPVVRQLTFLVQLLALGFKELGGKRGWELKQVATTAGKVEESLGFVMPAPRKSGQFAVTFNHAN
jgi:hypothetical protein